jgi:hypothetical protein
MMLSTKATGTEFMTGASGKVFYELRRERQAANTRRWTPRSRRHKAAIRALR